MKRFENLIISASAGTGKTYRLSLEYIALIVRYYEYESFSLDGVLALTFTRKASYEIRDRILEHLDSLIEHKDEGLLADLCRVLGRDHARLEVKEEGALISAKQEILCDKRKLQVMTIDSYISSIFRNIVRPLRSIDRYDIDLGAIEKRMPFLLKHLMQPQIRVRIDKLLQRKVERSLDDYAGFFSNLINSRWLYYVIRYRCPQNVYDVTSGAELRIFWDSIETLLNEVFGLIKAGAEFMDYFNSDFRNALQSEFATPQEALAHIDKLLSDPQQAHAMLKVLAKKNIYSGTRIRKAELKAQLNQTQDLVTRALADHLYFTLFLPEQQEILELWGIILEEYDRLIYRYKNMTYDDISWFTFEALFSQEPPAFDLSVENTATEFYHFLSHRTRFMLIDEFQDTSLIQFNILRPIIEEICAGYGSKDLGGVIVVGDEKQSIFGWRGGERDLLLNLKHIIGSLANAKSDVLADSWRSSTDMMKFINAIFLNPSIHSYLRDNNMQWDYPQVRSAIGDLSSIIELKFSPYSSRGELDDKNAVYEDFIENMVLPALKEDEDQKVAILCRKGKQLSDLQIMLEEKGITGVFQPSTSIVEHHLVSPLISWMKFVVYRDWYSLLCFLRSDYLLLSSTALKQAVDAISAIISVPEDMADSYIPDFGTADFLKQWYDLAIRHTDQTPYQSLRELMSILLTDEISKSKRDQLNLQAFLSLVRDWEINQASQGAKAADLLDFIEDNSKQESFQMVSVEGEDHLQLLTIHKSKGLQFDRVFVFYDLSDSGRNNEKKLYSSYRYTDVGKGDSTGQSIPGFQDIDAYALSYHYEDVLRHSSAKDLWEQKRRQSLLEELNALYVAFTRAKTALHVYFSYRGQKTWDEYYADKDEDSLRLPVILANTCKEFFDGVIPDQRGILCFKTCYPETKEKSPKPAKEKLKLSLEIGSLPRAHGLNWDATKAMKDNAVRDWKAVYLDKRQHLYGELAHYYLSFIRRDTDDEHSYAALQCLSHYGSLLSERVLRDVFESVKQELRKHSFLFAPVYDKVYTELPVNRLRIDRLMVNTQAKEALVIDYKTGGIHEEDQIDKYIAALKKLPAFSGYSFSGQYVNIRI